MVAKTASTKKASTKKAAPKKTASRSTKRANKVDYYPNRVPLLAVVTGVSLLMVITLIVTL